MSATNVSDFASRFLQQSVRLSRSLSDASAPLQLTPTRFLAHTGPVSARQPAWEPYEVPQWHRDSFGPRPEEQSRSGLRLALWNIAGAMPNAPQPRWHAVQQVLEQTKPNFLALLECTHQHELWFRRNPRFQHLFACTSLAEWDREQAQGVVASQGGPMLAIHKQFIGAGTRVRWTAFETPSSTQRDDNLVHRGRGLIIADLASREMPTLRIVVGQFDQTRGDLGFALRQEQYVKTMELLLELDQNAPLPTVFMGDFGPSLPQGMSPLFSTPHGFKDVAEVLATDQTQLETLNTMHVTVPFVAIRDAVPAVIGKNTWRLKKRAPSRPDRILLSSPSQFVPSYIKPTKVSVIGNQRCISATEQVAVGGRVNKRKMLTHKMGRDGWLYPSWHLGVVVEARLKYKEGSEESQLYQRFVAGRSAYEDRMRNVPSSVQEASGAFREIISALPRPDSTREPFAKRPRGRPIPPRRLKRIRSH